MAEPLQANREAAVKALRFALDHGEDWREPLWDCVRAFQGEAFRTAGRGKDRAGSTEFTYALRVSSRSGAETGELLVSTRQQGKTITRSSVELALKKALEVQRMNGCVKGPKRLEVFGASYLYVMFLRWGLIREKPEA